MVGQSRRCTGRTKAGGPCLADPMIDQEWCFWHHPDHVKEAADARRLGGQRRKREGMIVGAYDLGGLDSVVDLRRVLHIVLTDTVSLENGVSRSRTLIALVQAATKLLETGEFEERLHALESVLESRLPGRGTRR